MEAPEVHILIKQSWQLFGTFTFRQEEMSTGRRFKYVLCLVAQLWNFRQRLRPLGQKLAGRQDPDV
jgi:hypothetical protein